VLSGGMVLLLARRSISGADHVVVAARSESDGSLLWSWAPQPLGSETRFIGDVLVTNNLVFVSTNTTTYAISQSTHQPVWSIPVPGRLALSANGVLYVVAVDEAGNTNGTVVAVNVKD